VRAAAEFENELLVSKASGPARVGLAYLATIGEIPVEAGLRRAREASELDPESPVARLYFGRLLVMNGELAEGIAELERARTLAPASARIRYVLSQAYHQAGRTGDGEREMAEFQRLKPAHDSFRQSGRLPAAVFLGEGDASKPAGKK
jgi:hypothetical protein